MKRRESAMMNPRYVTIAGMTLAASAMVLALANRRVAPVVQAADFDAAVVTTGLEVPWDLVWGPDNMIWMSERGGRISRVDPATGRRTTAGEIAGVVARGESGLMGIALHPDFPRQPWVYAMHTYEANGLYNRLVRARWTGSAFDSQQVLLDRIPGGYIHDGSRVVVGRDRMLYVTTGDAGSADAAQDSASLAGKVLRLDLEGRVPSDNPFRSAVWSMGHRNGQGLVVHPRTGRLYETEHGSGDNDEVNIIERGLNYGWPNVRGVCDEQAEAEFCRRHRVAQPVATWTPTVAITGADLYLSDAVPRLKNALLATSLNGPDAVRDQVPRRRRAHRRPRGGAIGTIWKAARRAGRAERRRLPGDVESRRPWRAIRRRRSHHPPHPQTLMSPSSTRAILVMLLGASAACAQSTVACDRATAITPSGLGPVRIGMPADSLERVCRVVHGESVGLNGSVRRLVMVGGDTVRVWTTAGRVDWLELRSARHRTADSIAVGSPVERILDLPGVEGLAGDGGYVLLTSRGPYCGLMFWLEPRVAAIAEQARGDVLRMIRMRGPGVVAQIDVRGRCKDGNE